MANLTPWIKHGCFALLSFVSAFVLGGGGNLLWCSYAKDLPRQLPPGELEKSQDQMMNEIDQSMIRTGFICGFGGLALYLAVVAIKRKRGMSRSND